MLNLSPLFYTTDDSEIALHHKLELSDNDRENIKLAKTEVRACLRDGIPRVMKSKGYTQEVPKPRFFTQGSWAYKTLNAPAQIPQQADIHDGCYLPLSFVTLTRRPSLAATVFFQVVEEALAPLAAAKKWKLVTDKATCVRLEIAARAHIDVPLYVFGLLTDFLDAAEAVQPTDTKLVEQARADQDYLEAVIVATGNIIGIRSVQAAVSVEDVLDVMRSIAADVVQANRAGVLQ